MDQTKYGSFIKKMAEDFATGQENIYPIHIEDAQYVLSIHKYDQAYQDGSGHLKWHCDTVFTLHDDFRSHTGSTSMMGDGAITSLSRKQGMNTRSSTEVEVVPADEIVSPMIWT